MKLSFKEYYESKTVLLRESSSVVEFNTIHDVYKYCRVPFSLNESKTYVAFKPKDKLHVLWERRNGIISRKQFTIAGNTYLPLWNRSKMKVWVEQSTIQIFDTI